MARRGQAGRQSTQDSRQQVQQPAALTLLSSELGPHGSGCVAPAAHGCAASTRRDTGLAVNPPSSRSRPGRGRGAGAPPPQSREPVRLAATAEAARGPSKGLEPASPSSSSPAAARSHGRRACLRLSLSLSLAAAPSGGAHRRAPPPEVSVLPDTEEAEHRSGPHAPATPGTKPAPTPPAEPLRCALKRGWQQLGSACVLRGLPSRPWTSRDARALHPWTGLEENGADAAVGCRLEEAREQT